MGRAEAHVYTPSTLEVEAGESEGQTQSWIQSEFEANVGYLRLCLKIIIIIIIIKKVNYY